MMPKGRTGEAMAQIQTGDPSKQIDRKDVLNSHFGQAALVNSYFQEVNGQKNKQELMKRRKEKPPICLSGPKWKQQNFTEEP